MNQSPSFLKSVSLIGGLVGRCPILLGPVLALLLLAACGGGESTPAPERPAASAPQPGAAQPAPEQKAGENTIDPSTYKDRSREGTALAVAGELKPELVAALPPDFPDDIPLGNWLTISSVRQMGESDFVLSCFTSYPRGAVGEFFVRNMPELGWTLVSRSTKPILSVFTFRKGERAVTVMVKKQVVNEDVDFDISYKEN